ncbi:hypothetical protein JR316_0012258 [Psilocybe cubensis]|uniref:Uncharacterized protein n=1 Tax=Psilocybe cubensis TaxID=181762 RepID=A0ACB8GIE5_PSICU|nr:hypothetical protein JR316_0012258 [Psilocybe cubensis]KAH9475147.1 hypothetical protein JR316_0012258 [Psilocybe cubensis]
MDTTTISSLTIINQASDVPEGFPATNLIEVLLRHYIPTAISKFVRDVHSSNQVYFRASKIYNAILSSITHIQSANTAEWAVFDHYTLAIPVLERILLNFYVNHPEDIKRDHLPPTDGIESAIMFIEIMENDRVMLRNALKDLADEHFTILSGGLQPYLVADASASRRKDDIDTIKALNAYISSNKLMDVDIDQPLNGKLLTSVRMAIGELAEKLINHLFPENLTALGIKTIMLAYVPFALITAGTISTEWREYFKSHTVWRAVESLTTNVLSQFVSGESSGKLAALEEEWRTVRGLLLKLQHTDVSTSEEILHLVKLAANIRRPFHGRVVEIVKMLYDIHIYSHANQILVGQKTRKLREIKQVMRIAIEGFESLKLEVTDVREIVLTDNPYKKQSSRLKELLTTVEGLFSELPEKREYWVRKYNNAAEIDETHLEWMRTRLGLIHQSYNISEGMRRTEYSDEDKYSDDDDEEDDDDNDDSDSDDDREDFLPDTFYSDGKVLQTVNFEEQPISKRQPFKLLQETNNLGASGPALAFVGIGLGLI